LTFHKVCIELTFHVIAKLDVCELTESLTKSVHLKTVQQQLAVHRQFCCIDFLALFVWVNHTKFVQLFIQCNGGADIVRTDKHFSFTITRLVIL